jgi:hypothetical protein
MTNRTDGLDAAGVAVKALDWDETDERWWGAQPFHGFCYEIRVTDRGDTRVRWPENGGWENFAGTLDEAKAFAQADFTARISALVDAPAGETVPQLGGAPDDLHNLIKVTFADITIERMNEVCKQVLAMRKPVASPTPVAEGEAQPVAWRYRWKLDGEWTKWHISDASQKSRHLRDLEEHPLFASPRPAVSEAISAAMMFECAACTAAGIETNCYTADTSFLVGDKCLCEDCYAECGSDAVAPRIADILTAALSSVAGEE